MLGRERAVNGDAERKDKHGRYRFMNPEHASFPIPRIYRATFQRRPAYVVLHWHWYWSSADVLHVLLPPAPGLVKSEARSAAVEALAHAFVADLLADLEADHREEHR